MFAEALVVLSVYWPQTISVSDPIHTETRTSWLVTSNNSVNLHFSGLVNNMKLSGFGSISDNIIMPNDEGTFTVSIDQNDLVTLVVSGDTRAN